MRTTAAPGAHSAPYTARHFCIDEVLGEGKGRALAGHGESWRLRRVDVAPLEGRRQSPPCSISPRFRLNPSIQIRAIRTTGFRTRFRLSSRCLNPSIQIRAIRTYGSHVRIICLPVGSQSLNTDQGNSDNHPSGSTYAPTKSLNPSIQIRAIRTAPCRCGPTTAGLRLNPSIQIRAIRTIARNQMNRVNLLASQSLNTDQGNSDATHKRPNDWASACTRKSQSLNTDQGDSDELERDVYRLTSQNESQFLNTDQGNSDGGTLTLNQFFGGILGLNPSIQIRAIRTPKWPPSL